MRVQARRLVDDQQVFVFVNDQGQAWRSWHALTQGFLDHFAAIDRRPFVPSVVQIRQPLVIHADEMEDGRVNVVNVRPIFNCAQPDLIGLANDGAGFDGAAGHPNSEALRIVIAAFAFFIEGSAAKFAGPDHQRAVQQTAGFKVGQQRPDWFVGGLAELGVIVFQIDVGIPPAVAAGVTLHEPDSAFDEPPG